MVQRFNKPLAVLFHSLFGYMYLQTKLTGLYLAVLSFKLMFQCCLSLDTISYEILDSVLRKKRREKGEEKNLMDQSKWGVNISYYDARRKYQTPANEIQPKYQSLLTVSAALLPCSSLVPFNYFFFTLKYWKWQPLFKWLHRFRSFCLP